MIISCALCVRQTSAHTPCFLSLPSAMTAGGACYPSEPARGQKPVVSCGSLTVSDFRVDLGRLRALSASVIAQVQCTTAALSCFFGTGRAKQKHMWPLATREPFTHAVRVRTTPVRQKEATLLCRSGIVRNLPAPVPPSCGVSTPGCVDCAGLRCPAKLNRPSGVWLAPAMAARAGIMRVNGIGGWH